MPWYTQTFQFTIALQSKWYTSGFLTISSDQSESSLVSQIRRSIFLSSSLLPSLCVWNVCKVYPRPGFSIENVLKLHMALHCTAVHNFCQKCVFIICPIQMYDILRISGWQVASPQLENPAMAWACKVQNFATAVGARKVCPDVMVAN